MSPFIAVPAYTLISGFQSLIGNWVTDCLRPAYDEALAKLGYNKVDGIIIDCGVLRGGHIYQPGLYPYYCRPTTVLITFI